MDFKRIAEALRNMADAMENKPVPGTETPTPEAVPSSTVGNPVAGLPQTGALPLPGAQVPDLPPLPGRTLEQVYPPQQTASEQPAAPTVSREDVTNAFQVLFQQKGAPAAMEALRALGVQRISLVPENQLPAAMQQLQEALK